MRNSLWCIVCGSGYSWANRRRGRCNAIFEP